MSTASSRKSAALRAASAPDPVVHAQNVPVLLAGQGTEDAPFARPVDQAEPDAVQTLAGLAQSAA